MTDIKKLVRPNILALKPYSSARSLYTKGLLMDANENPYNIFGNGAEINRYPDGSNKALRKKLAGLFSMDMEQCAVGNGSDELIDILFRIFCEPGRDAVIICSPTYGMYEVSANIHNIRVIDVPLVNNRIINVPGVLKQAEAPGIKMIFFCNPNNPTGSLAGREDMLAVIKQSGAIVVVDEAYADFMRDPSLISEIKKYNNLVVVRTLSKAYALAGARLGYVFACEEVIELIQKVKPPYNVNVLTTRMVLAALEKRESVIAYTKTLIEEREKLIAGLKGIKGLVEIFPSEANFILFRIDHADALFGKLIEKGIILRSRSNMPGLKDCLRVSVGSREQNELFLKAIKELTQ